MQPSLFERPRPTLTTFDVILVNSSAGKDSQAMLDYMVELADAEGVRDRMVVVHCDLGRVEWPGTPELAAEHAAHYGLRFEKVARDRDLLHQIEFERKMFPDSARRYCTSDQKTSQVKKVITALVAERARPPFGFIHADGRVTRQPVRVLNCLGLRSQESPARAKKIPLGPDNASNGKRTVVRWLPIFDWLLEDVWARNAQAGTRHHYAYDLGMPRLSCCMCVLASNSAVMLGARHNPELAREYVRIEAKIGHSFKQNITIAELVAAANASDDPIRPDDWNA